MGPDTAETAIPARRRWRGRVPVGLMTALVTWAYLATLMRNFGGVPLLEWLRVTGYFLGILVLPGTLVWRRLRVLRRDDEPPSRPLLEDLILGTVLGYAMELPVYLLARRLDHPAAIWFWPMVVLLVCAVEPRGRMVLGRRLNAAAPPAWFTIGLALLCALAMTYLALFTWVPWPGSSIDALQAPYVDEPFHLALTTEFRHHVPAEIPYVAGTPLYYHWLVYAHLASSSWATGIEPATLLRVVNLPIVIVVTVAALGVVAARLSRTWWTGLVAASGLVLLSSPQLFRPWLGQPGGSPFSTSYASPTQVFATLMVTLFLLVAVELLQREVQGIRWWVMFAGMFLAVAGSKSAFPPILVCGLAAAAGLALLLRRRLDWVAIGLTVTGVLGFLVAQKIFYGTGSRSLVVDPLMSLRWIAGQVPVLREPDRTIPPGVSTILLVWFVTSALVSVAGAAGQLRGGGWRDPAFHFLFVAFLAGLGGLLVLGHPGLSQFYFYSSARVPALLVTAMGLARLDARGHPAGGRGATLAAAVGVITAITLIPSLTSHTPAGRDDPYESAMWGIAVPLAIFWLLVAALILVTRNIMRRRGFTLEQRILASALLLLFLSSDLPITQVRDLIADGPSTPRGRVEIPQGGVSSARWLRDHSSVADLVATNNHCTSAPEHGCGHRSFWLAAHAERRVLVQGWGYIPPETVGQPSTPLTNGDHAPFWDSARLDANEAAFNHPSTQTLDRLRDEYHVRWLVADLRYPSVDLAGLQQSAELVHQDGQVAVLRVR